MLRVESYNNLSEPKSFRATRVVVYDETTNNPIIVVVELTNGNTFVSRQGDPDFNKVLTNLGIGRTVVVTDQDFPKITDFIL